ncbi:MAG TPA: arginyltransferase [Hellea balneolensis]|uniref:Aspartate/glutamate leucyltransferase n=1 Tax=Hellea balneolensis TaxID=287478 RepID=A0A7C5QRD8_9PROT|nr:arginyltransferase [Hellea balneolensis]
MTRHFDPNDLQFYITLPAPCPYLPGETERKIFTPLDSFLGPQLNDYLTHSGFRRSQNVIYRPACENCRACQSLRVKAQEFKLTPSFRRVLKINSDLSRKVVEAIATNEQYELLVSYLNARHPGGGMTDMDFERYEMMVEDCAANTEIFEYRDSDDRLIAACITDNLRDGLSMVYSFFDPNLSKRGLGNFMILDHLRVCKSIGFAHLYLGYWVKNSHKMRYKSRYKPFEILGTNGWVSN